MSGDPPKAGVRRFLRRRFSLASLLIAIAVLAVPLALLSYWFRQEPRDETTILVGKHRPATWQRIAEKDFRKLGLTSPAAPKTWTSGDPASAMIQRIPSTYIDDEVLLFRDNRLRGHGMIYGYSISGRVFQNGAYRLQPSIGPRFNHLYDKLDYDPDTRILTVTLGEESPRRFQILELRLRVLEDGKLELVSVKPDEETQPGNLRAGASN